jgi:hypothetical protein
VDAVQYTGHRHRFNGPLTRIPGPGQCTGPPTLFGTPYPVIE